MLYFQIFFDYGTFLKSQWYNGDILRNNRLEISGTIKRQKRDVEKYPEGETIVLESRLFIQFRLLFLYYNKDGFNIMGFSSIELYFTHMSPKKHSAWYITSQNKCLLSK